MNLNKLNSITKYPSIPTYHELGERGAPTNKHENVSGVGYVTEKIDGTNTRIIVFPDGDYIIGSREELLTAKGDRIYNPSNGIVDAVRDVAERLALVNAAHCFVVFGEVYGGKINAHKQYTTTGEYGFRVFDVMMISQDAMRQLVNMEVRQIAMWRDAGGQKFFSVDALLDFCTKAGLERVPFIGLKNMLPDSLADTKIWLGDVAKRSAATLDDHAEAQPEGVVVRSADRSWIVKLRFEDYRKVTA